MKSILIALLLLTPLQHQDAYAATSADEAVLYEEIVEQAINNCPNKKAEKVNSALLWELVEIEKQFNVPVKLRGMILAAACKESGYNPSAKGDRKFSKDGKTPMAIGILQMWKIYEKMYPGIDRTDPKSAATGWMKHIVSRIPKVKRLCKYRTEERIWVAAWVTGIRSKKKGGRCKERPLHLKTLKKWHRNIERERKKEREQYMPPTKALQKGDGC
tara:strand:+ start:367 stop:1014 length:648 start_codon:yes stop_codon:yes gene_type:complete